MKRQMPCDIAFVFGTSAELIKLWPLITDLSPRSRIGLFSTNQQPTELAKLGERLGVKDVVHLRDPALGNLVSKSSIPMWAIGSAWQFFRNLRVMRTAAQRNGRNVLVLVHGDTMTCLLGAFVARLGRCRVAHVEAGLRSHDWKNPFPEEIDRRLTARLAHIHFCPDQTAVENLAGRRGIKINTHGNTSRDSMFRIQDDVSSANSEGPYVLVSLHRAELLSSGQTLVDTITQLVEISKERKVVMVLDALTRESLTSRNLLTLLVSSQVDVREKMPYPEFLTLVLGAERVVTDSGGLQEECGFLSIPCLVHRKATERGDGIGTTARLSMWENNSITSFCNETHASVRSRRRLGESDSPTSIIVSTLESLGLLPC